MAHADVEAWPLRPSDLGDLAALFECSRNTRRCWCMAFCEGRRRFALGWFTGDNRRRFEAMVNSEGAPMGVLASLSNKPVGWCACGPRSRYSVADRARHGLLRGSDPREDDVVWQVACLFVHPDFRHGGVTNTLVRCAVDLAKGAGAQAVEAWPTTDPELRPADAFLGRIETFDHLGFATVRRPVPNRAIMRLELYR